MQYATQWPQAERHCACSLPVMGRGGHRLEAATGRLSLHSHQLSGLSAAPVARLQRRQLLSAMAKVNVFKKCRLFQAVGHWVHGWQMCPIVTPESRVLPMQCGCLRESCDMPEA